MTEIRAIPLDIDPEEAPHDYEVWTHDVGPDRRSGALTFRRHPLIGRRTKVEAVLKRDFGIPSTMTVLGALWDLAPPPTVRLGALVTMSLIQVERADAAVRHEVLTSDIWVPPEGYAEHTVNLTARLDLNQEYTGRVTMPGGASLLVASAVVADAELAVYNQVIGRPVTNPEAGDPVHVITHHMPDEPHKSPERLHRFSDPGLGGA